MIEKVVSGGQTGVDQAALSMAVEAGIPIGGWCPKGGLDANGMNVLLIYPCLKEETTTEPNERTRLNIDNSDGTLIIVPSIPLPSTIIDGTSLTIDYAYQKNKPHLIISLQNTDSAIHEISSWIADNNITILNIGGPRESSWPGIHEESCLLLKELFFVLHPKLGMNS